MVIKEKKNIKQRRRSCKLRIEIDLNILAIYPELFGEEAALYCPCVSHGREVDGLPALKYRVGKIRRLAS